MNQLNALSNCVEYDALSLNTVTVTEYSVTEYCPALIALSDYRDRPRLPYFCKYANPLKSLTGLALIGLGQGYSNARNSWRESLACLRMSRSVPCGKSPA